jgi:hypothetical protein
VLNKQVKVFKTGEEGSESIKKAYEAIFKSFERNNEATNQLIEKKYKENLYAMERRVASILEVFNEEVTKNKKMSYESVKEIKQLIEKAMTIVESVEGENLELRASLRSEKYRAKLMEEERNLLLE